MMSDNLKRLLVEFWHTMFNQTLDYQFGEKELRDDLQALKELADLVRPPGVESMTDERIEQLVHDYARYVK